MDNEMDILMNPKIDVYKTIGKAISAGYYESKSDYVSGFNKENEYLLNNIDSDDFKKIVDNEILNRGIYISLAKVKNNSSDSKNDTVSIITSNGEFNVYAYDVIADSDYGILVDKFLYHYDYCRLDNGEYTEFLTEDTDNKILKYMHQCIIRETPGEESFHIVTYEEWLDEMKDIENFDELDKELKIGIYNAAIEIDMHLSSVDENELKFEYGGGCDDARYTGNDMVDAYTPGIMLDFLSNFIETDKKISML